MKKQFILFVSLMAFVFSSIAQTTEFQLPIGIKNDDGSSSFFDIKKGDKLVYQVNAGGSQYEFIITINGYNSKKAMDFNYEMTNANNTRGHVTISPEAQGNATKYVNYFRGGELNLTDACTVWLSGKNFRDLSERKTIMQLDNNAPETFYLPKEDDVETVVKIKGEDKTVTGFKINNAEDGKGNKTIWINDLSANSLIIKMDLGWSIVLKEIR